jgi:hypothetical protein
VGCGGHPNHDTAAQLSYEPLLLLPQRRKVWHVVKVVEM